MFDDINRLCQLSGASYEKAKKEYIESGEDLYKALGSLQAQGFDGKGFSRQQNSFAPEASRENFRENFRERHSEAFEAGKSGVEKFMASYLKVNDLHVPLILAVLAVIFGFELIIPAVIIALICRVNFSFEGPLFDNGVAPAFGTGSFSSSSFGRSFRNKASYSAPRYEDRGVAYEMPPKYEYDYAYTGNSTSSEKKYERDISEEKGFF